MPKTRRTKRNGKAPLTRNSTLVLVAQGESVIKGRAVAGKPKGKLITGKVYTGEPVSKAYPYGSARQGYGAAPRVIRRRPVSLIVDGAGTIHEAP
jgi:hypothetical protein